MPHHPAATTPTLLRRMAWAAAFATGLSGCVSTSEPAHVGAQRDAGTCAGFGSPYGSPAYADCMLTQQRRRDNEDLRALEKQRMTIEIARDAQIISDRARRQRCERDPDRRECGPRER